MDDRPLRICFVCLGNICRSPMAAAVMRRRLSEAGLGGRVAVESAGTGDWHVGQAADPRAAAEVRRRGIPMAHVARHFRRDDFRRFDLLVAMDGDNVRALHALAPDTASRERVRLLRAFDPRSEPDAPVPDPYFGGAEGFATTFDLIDAACRGLVQRLRAGTGAPPG